MNDKEIAELIAKETQRQRDGLEMIPSENHTSPDVLAALGSRLTDKYSEGYPGMRYYETLSKTSLAIEQKHYSV
jgi:glycine hydroxymethyltransferase